MKRAKEGAGETELPLSLNIAGITLGHSQANDGEMIKLLREGVDASLAQGRTVHGEITKVREGMDANRNEAQAIRAEITKLRSQLELQNNKLELQNSHLAKLNGKFDVHTKMQNLAFAVQNAEANAFNYYDAEIDKVTVSSRDLVRLILLSFRQGYARILPNKQRYMEYGHNSNVAARLKSEQVFRDKLSQQIHELIGVKPHFEFEKERDSYWICYPGTSVSVNK